MHEQDSWSKKVGRELESSFESKTPAQDLSTQTHWQESVSQNLAAEIVTSFWTIESGAHSDGMQMQEPEPSAATYQ